MDNLKIDIKFINNLYKMCPLLALQFVIDIEETIQTLSLQVYYSILGLDTIVEKKKVRNYYE